MLPNWCMTSRFEAQPIATTLVAKGVAVLSLPSSSVARRAPLEPFESCRNWIGNNLLDRKNSVSYPEFQRVREGRLDEQVPASYAVGALHASSPISHVIPLRLPQTLKWHRWNCNVLSGARKMTVGNYVRLLSGKVRRCRCCPAGALHASSPISHASSLSTFHVMKDERWDCNVFGLCRIFAQSNCMRLFGNRPR